MSFTGILVDSDEYMYTMYSQQGFPMIYKIIYDYTGDLIGVEYYSPPESRQEIKIID